MLGDMIRPNPLRLVSVRNIRVIGMLLITSAIPRGPVVRMLGTSTNSSVVTYRPTRTLPLPL